jgi:UDPglucose--hexose-1-phosphate uridylyltransferase
MLDLQKETHRRYNPLTQEWVLVSPRRMDRPWQGEVTSPATDNRPSFDPNCYLCPGNPRANGIRNPAYESTFVFENDFPAMQEASIDANHVQGELIRAESERGICRVLSFSPRHDLALPQMGVEDIRNIVDAWTEQYLDLGQKPFINWVQIFENRGTMMGISNLHPHCQIWANRSIPTEPQRECAAQTEYQSRRQRCLLCDYLQLELKSGERLVCETEHFLAVVPFWAVWPFEVLLVSKPHATSLDEFSDTQRTDLARILEQLTCGYDKLFAVPFPYSMGFHQRPTDGEAHREWHFHAHFFPPLLRSASVRKFMVGYEMLAMPQRDLTAESAAERLRGCVEHRDLRL